ncbi:hypothetical protein NCCP1664_07530 [Zafaria cholistanensis]|uniref:Uncharacterized protein n=1 Tax=Zafaria cholistanensis TaxID=1682741 RepID=A0A5A7NNZ9_9MICC|nr:right-handed parallel beta-helix repeat-containing protein [Zafaria cholistanensis]GER22256.1 hypothetical protein NCCP1664_07530 [Zafaria cholistanensis]
MTKRPLALLAVLLTLALGAVVLAMAATGPSGGRDSGAGAPPGAPASGSAPTPSAVPDATAPPSASGAVPGCPEATVTVATDGELHNVLEEPEPGTVIVLADGVYEGNFTGTGDGTADRPITVCGSARAILDGGGIEEGYVFHLDQAAHWVLQGFTVRNGQKGVMADEVTHSVIRGLTVTDTGDEAVHLRKFSTDNRVLGNTISDTGQRKPKFGEGIYIGTAESNWCDISNCKPDRSDRNEIVGNTISATTAESVDIKEGTSNGVLRDNRFDGAGLKEADSWVDVKGKGWTIAGNAGTNSPKDGYQTHEILDGWGTGNVFRGNTAHVNGPGYGYALTPVLENVVECSNRATAAKSGLSNEPCAS